MKVGGTNRFAYNAQAVVDSKEGVVVACDASRQETDAGQLVPMIEQARENLGVAGAASTTLADTGYGAGAVNPYLAFETLADLHKDGMLPPDLALEDAKKNFIKAANKGILKVAS